MNWVVPKMIRPISSMNRLEMMKLRFLNSLMLTMGSFCDSSQGMKAMKLTTQIDGRGA